MLVQLKLTELKNARLLHFCLILKTGHPGLNLIQSNLQDLVSPTMKYSSCGQEDGIRPQESPFPFTVGF